MTKLKIKKLEDSTEFNSVVRKKRVDGFGMSKGSKSFDDEDTHDFS
jgi:hypothetical protein